MTEIRCRVRDLRPETEFAVTVGFEPLGTFAYRAGQHLKIGPHQFTALADRIREAEAARGKPLGPGYFSIASDGLDPRCLEITVKLPPGNPPLLAGHLARGLKAGDEVVLDGPGGKFGLPEAAPEGIASFIHLCAGSGAVPHRGMVRHALGKGWPQRHLVMVQDRTAADALYSAEWADLQARHREHLRVVRLFSREKGQRIDGPSLRAAGEGFVDWTSSWAFLCGPNQPRGGVPGFQDACKTLLAGLGLPPDRIRTE